MLEEHRLKKLGCAVVAGPFGCIPFLIPMSIISLLSEYPLLLAFIKGNHLLSAYSVQGDFFV